MKIDYKHPCHMAAFAAASWWYKAVTGGRIASLGDERACGDAMVLSILARTTGQRAEGTAAEKFAQDLYDFALVGGFQEWGVTLSTDYGPEDKLYELAAQYRLGGCFPNKTRMYVKIDLVTVAAGYHAPTVVLYDAFADDVQKAYFMHDGACPDCGQPWQAKHFEGSPPAVREIICWTPRLECAAAIKLVGRKEAARCLRVAAGGQ